MSWVERILSSIQYLEGVLGPNKKQINNWTVESEEWKL